MVSKNTVGTERERELSDSDDEVLLHSWLQPHGCMVPAIRVRG